MAVGLSCWVVIRYTVTRSSTATKEEWGDRVGSGVGVVWGGAGWEGWAARAPVSGSRRALQQSAGRSHAALTPTLGPHHTTIMHIQARSSRLPSPAPRCCVATLCCVL